MRNEMDAAISEMDNSLEQPDMMSLATGKTADVHRVHVVGVIPSAASHKYRMGAAPGIAASGMRCVFSTNRL